MDFRLGDYRDVLSDVTCDALICDPPFSDRTHNGHNNLVVSDGFKHRILSYTAWTAEDVREFVTFWATRTRGWMVCMTDHHLIGAYQAAYEAAGRYAFAPVWIVQNSVRLVGDGPASPGVYLMVSRPKTREYSTWGALPGHYISHREPGRRIGGKPFSLMRDIVRDYSREGDLVCDPVAGGGTTLYAARQCGRRAIGAEIDAAAYAAALGAPDDGAQGILL